MASSAMIGSTFLVGGPGTGALGGPPTGHNYKRAVYRPPPKEFCVEVLPPTKFGSGHCYGLRIFPVLTDEQDNRSSRSSSSHHEYEIWRRWEDCLWFQEILESEYALMARQKRARLAAGKGVKKNGVYIHSDQAASFESLPPGPDANSIAKDIHDVIPRLNKKATLFRASQATIEQRGREFEALILALFQDDVPMLVKELRETRLVRDFFGYWRRDLDHDRKRQSASGAGGKQTPSARYSIASSAFSMYFSASNISLHNPTAAFADLPPSPALNSFPSATSQDSSRRNSTQPDERRRSTGRAPVNYATSDSSASTASLASTSRGPPPHSPTSPAQDMTFYVSERGSLALNIADDSDERAEFINSPLSAPARVQPHPWTRDGDRSFPSPEDEILLADAVGKPRQDAAPGPGEFQPGLQALPEDSELIPAAVTSGPQHSDIEEVPRVPLRRPRNNSCPDRTNRQCLFIPAEGPKTASPAGLDGLSRNADALRIPPHRESEPRTPTTSSSSRTSSLAYSSFSNFTGDDASRRSSWRTSMASETSYTHSFATSFANGSCADFERQSRHSFASSFANGSCADFERGRDPRQSVSSVYSVVSSNGRQTALAHRDSMTTLNSLLSDLSIDSGYLNRSLTPPTNGVLRRSLSAGSRRPPSIMAALGGQDDWDQQEEFLDAYFYDPGMQPPMRFEEPPRTPPPPPQREPAVLGQPFNREVCTPDRFPKPFQNRPPGQFHLPWSPPSTPGIEHSEPAYVVPPRTPPPVRPSTSGSMTSSNGFPGSPPNSPTTATESLTVKAILQDSIVLLRILRAAPLEEVRTRIRDKFAVQEGVQLSNAFVIGWAPAATQPSGVAALSVRGRPRSNSASSVGTLNPQALRYVRGEQEWRTAVASCAGGKMTIRLFNAQPI
ncbi:hypothetical protein L226DRAFT_68775 [Lentinus tigrinus ALCF2SS1-7]|uniref:uncharacterized protein n=1 Tax=Lentinus tigrinus ALCF2SS1-7 TaxID=1328758 RepID=UPI001165FF92|nr:hypothetical protein L226DRAFT_68775 [Lentinus tigrinus ALCF2SS1-7]